MIFSSTDFPNNWYKTFTIAPDATEIQLIADDLKLGLHAASLEVQEIPSNGDKTDFRKNVFTCYFDVQPELLRVVIAGGAVVRLKLGPDISLDGSGSYNPNVPEDQQKMNLVYSWSCWAIDKPDHIHFCREPEVELSKSTEVYNYCKSFSKL